jgi:hypothetical protein
LAFKVSKKLWTFTVLNTLAQFCEPGPQSRAYLDAITSAFNQFAPIQGVRNLSYHAETVTTYKTFAFLGKYLECLGWVLCFSLILVAPGVTLLLGGQLAQIFQRQEQHLAGLSGGGAVPAPAGAPPDAAAPPAGRRCPRCGKEYPESWAGSFCDDCGAPLG